MNSHFTSGIHIEEAEAEEEVDTSLRGRLLSLVDKVKNFRKKQEEEKPEAEEESKPSKINPHYQLNIQKHCLAAANQKYQH